MSDSILNIIINTVKRGGGDKEAINNLVKMKTQFKEMTGINLSSVTAWAMAGAAIVKVIDVLKKAVEYTVQYATKVEDLSRLIGTNAEESSTLIQVADDLFISYEKLSKGMETAIKKGYEPTLDGLLEMQKEYQNLTDPIEKSKFALDRFGKSGTEMAKLLEAPPEKLKQLAAQAKETGLVLNDQQVKNVKMYKQSLDNLNDSIDALKVSIGMGLIPQLDYLSRQLTPGVDATEEFEKKIFALNEEIQKLTKYGVMGGLTIEEVARQIQAAKDKIAELSDEQLVNMGAAEKEAEQVDILKSSFKELTKEMVYNQLAAHLDYEGQLELARQMGLLNENTFRALSAVEALTATYDTNANGLIDPIEMTKQYRDALAAVISTAGTYAWNFVVNSNMVGFTMAPGPNDIDALIRNSSSGPSSGSSTGWVYKGTKGGAGTDKAWYNGSSWYYGDKPPGAATGGMVKVGEHGTEIVKLPDGAFVYNNEQTQQMLGASNITNYFNISGAGDPSKVADEIVRKLDLNGMRRRS